MSEHADVSTIARMLEDRMNRADRYRDEQARKQDDFRGRLERKVDEVLELAEQASGNANEAKKVAAQTLEQSIKTNGRVTRLELWRERIMGGLTVLASLGAIAALRELVTAVLN